MNKIEHGAPSLVLTAVAACFALAALLATTACQDSKSPKLPVDVYKLAGKTVEESAASINRVLTSPRQELSLRMPVRRTNDVSAPVQVVQDLALPFRVGGIVRNNEIPLVLTTAGVAGKGEKLAGWTVVSVDDDNVTFADSSGMHRTVQLYDKKAHEDENP